MEIFEILLEGLFAAFKVLFILIWEIFKWPLIIIGIIVAILFVFGFLKAILTSK